MHPQAQPRRTQAPQARKQQLAAATAGSDDHQHSFLQAEEAEKRTKRGPGKRRSASLAGILGEGQARSVQRPMKVVVSRKEHAEREQELESPLHKPTPAAPA